MVCFCHFICGVVMSFLVRFCHNVTRFSGYVSCFHHDVTNFAGYVVCFHHDMLRSSVFIITQMEKLDVTNEPHHIKCKNVNTARQRKTSTRHDGNTTRNHQASSHNDKITPQDKTSRRKE